METVTAKAKSYSASSYPMIASRMGWRVSTNWGLAATLVTRFCMVA